MHPILCMNKGGEKAWNGLFWILISWEVLFTERGRVLVIWFINKWVFVFGLGIFGESKISWLKSCRLCIQSTNIYWMSIMSGSVVLIIHSQSLLDLLLYSHLLQQPKFRPSGLLSPLFSTSCVPCMLLVQIKIFYQLVFALTLIFCHSSL